MTCELQKMPGSSSNCRKETKAMSFNKKQYRNNEWEKRSKINASERNQFKQQM